MLILGRDSISTLGDFVMRVPFGEKLFLLSLIGFGLPIAASADEISVSDCHGTLRAVRQIEEGTTSRVTVSLNDKYRGQADKFELTLLNSATDTAEKRFTQAGQAIFDNVAPGNWRVCSSLEQDAISAVSIASPERDSYAVAGVLGLGAIGGGLAMGLSRDGGAETLTASESGSASTGSSATTGAAAQGSAAREPAAASNKPPCALSEDCMTDATPVPISPIS